MNKQNILEISENILERSIKKFLSSRYNLTLRHQLTKDKILKTLALDDLPKFVMVFCAGLVSLQMFYTLILYVFNYPYEAQILISTILVCVFIVVSIFYFLVGDKHAIPR